MAVSPSEQSNNQPADERGPVAQDGISVSAVHVSHILQQCPNCGAVAGSGVTVCQECGEDLTRKVREIRCRHCHHRAPDSLMICPNCARELKPAPSRLLTWGAPALLVLLFFFFLVGRGNPLPNMRTQLERARIFVIAPGEMSSGVAPVVAMTPVPAGEAQADALASQPGVDQPGDANSVLALLPTATATPFDTPTVMPTATDIPTEAPTETSTKTPTKTSTPEPTSSPTRTPKKTPTDAPTRTSTRTPTRASTMTPKSTVTPTAKAGIQLPTSTPTPAAPENESAIYTIRPGDTLLGIAIQFGVSTQALMDANDIASSEVYAIRPGQELDIPASDGSGAVGGLIEEEATATPAPTATDVDKEPTATPTATKAPVRLDTPQLLSPEPDTPVSCRGSNSLVWGSAPFILDSDKYILHLGFLSGKDDAGGENITWILNQPSPSNRTSWEMDNGLCALAPQDMGRQWRWFVQVVDESSTPVSRPSETWGFSWN